MNPSPADVARFSDQDWTELEQCVDDRLSMASGLLGVALIDVNGPDGDSAHERLLDHVDPEDHTARLGPHRYVIVRCPLIGPAEMEGLGLRIADSFPESVSDGPITHSTVHIGIVTGRSGDVGRTLLRHAKFGLDDARVVGRPIVTIDDVGRLCDGDS